MKIKDKLSRFTDKKKYLFFSQLYSLLKSGLSFSRSFELLIANEKENEAVIFKEIYKNILSGNELWFALKDSSYFSNLDVGVVRIGEETGKLDQSLEFLANYYTKKNEQRRILLGALSYPLIILIVAILVLSFMITVVVPMFSQVYSRMGGELPDITYFIINVSRHAPVFLIFIAFVVFAYIFLKFYYGKTEQYRKISSGLLLHLPTVGNLIKMYYQSQFCQLMHLLISSNI